jgi:hypothetical protein
LPMKAMTNPLPRMATGLGMTTSPLPQGQLDDNEPLATNSLRIRTANAVQGNNKPFATKSDWYCLPTTYAWHKHSQSS